MSRMSVVRAAATVCCWATCVASWAMSATSVGDDSAARKIVEPDVNARACRSRAAAAASGPWRMRTWPRSTPTCGSIRARTAVSSGLPPPGAAMTEATDRGSPALEAGGPRACGSTRWRRPAGAPHGDGGEAAPPRTTRAATASASRSSESPGRLTESFVWTISARDRLIGGPRATASTVRAGASVSGAGSVGATSGASGASAVRLRGRGDWEDRRVRVRSLGRGAGCELLLGDVGGGCERRRLLRLELEAGFRNRCGRLGHPCGWRGLGCLGRGRLGRVGRRRERAVHDPLPRRHCRLGLDRCDRLDDRRVGHGRRFGRVLLGELGRRLVDLYGLERERLREGCLQPLARARRKRPPAAEDERLASRRADGRLRPRR